MFKYYEVVLIFTQLLSNKKQYLNEIIDWFNKKKVIISYKEHWGLNNLSYNIYNNNMGYYDLIQFKLTKQIKHNNFLYDLENKIRLNESIIRFIIIKLNKYGIKYAEIRKEKILNKNFFIV
jgi:small subunit ribosomal protein S6